MRVVLTGTLTREMATADEIIITQTSVPVARAIIWQDLQPERKTMTTTTTRIPTLLACIETRSHQDGDKGAAASIVDLSNPDRYMIRTARENWAPHLQIAVLTG